MLRKAISACGLCLFLVAGLNAQDDKQETTDKPTTEKVEKKKGKKQGGKKGLKRKARMVAQITKKDFGAIELTAEQKSKLETLVDEKFEKFVETEKAMNELVPKEKRKVRQEAFKTAKAEGKKYAEAFKAGLTAVALSEDDTKKMLELVEAKKKLMNSIRSGVTESLSEDQKTKLAQTKKANRKGKGKKGKKGNKKKDEAKTPTQDSLDTVKQ